MKLHFSNVDFSSRTGPNTFAHRIADELIKRGHQIVGQDDHYDIFLCFIEPGSLPRQGSKIIQRLDGIWFKPDQFQTHNQRIKWAYDNCHHVIWQSEFDKQMTTKWWGQKSGTVIHNGIEQKKAEVSGEIRDLKRRFNRIFTCSANWHRQKRLKENIDLFLSNAEESDVLLVLGKNPDFQSSDSRVKYLGSLDHQACLQLYSVSDWFLHLAWLDHCPNVVIEALSQGCPIICSDSGGTKEIVRENGIIVQESEIYEFQLADYDNPPALNAKISIPEKYDVKCEYLDIKRVADQYESIF